jgi:hypothetical protein
MSATERKYEVPVFDGTLDIVEPWEIQWNMLAKVEGTVDELGPKLDSKMPQNNKHAL